MVELLKEYPREGIAPAQLLKDKYIPIEDVPDKRGVSVETVQMLISKYKLRYAEFYKDGAYRRSIFINPDDLDKMLTDKGIERK